MCLCPYLLDPASDLKSMVIPYLDMHFAMILTDAYSFCVRVIFCCTFFLEFSSLSEDSSTQKKNTDFLFPLGPTFI